MEYHVAMTGADSNSGTPGEPFRTVQHASDVVAPGDTVTVHEGVYRERIDPSVSGESDRRITFQAAEGESATIKGSEVITGWSQQDGDVWKVTLPNSYFGGFNPYANVLAGDWFFPHGRTHHSGQVYINDNAINEAGALDDLYHGAGSNWYGSSNELGTHIWVSCPGIDPNRELTEINVRQSVFYPSRPGINCITLRGFTLSQAATPWSPPTTEQIGLVGTNWSTGWIIENNTVTHSRCTGITLGKFFDREDGTIEYGFNAHYQAVQRVFSRGDWKKGTVGGHVVRDNEIAHCEQSGIVGSHGAAFCEIYGNHIHDIHTRTLFGGFEQAGIKIHAAVDTTIRENLIHDCWMGIWLDWMNQGSRVSSNVMFNNDSDCDLFIEIAHGPVLVDNNVLMSRVALLDSAQGGAYVHNLFGGEVRQRAELHRSTPYFKPHSTEPLGDSKVFDGDERFYNNIVTTDGGLALYDSNSGNVVADSNVYLYRARPAAVDANARTFPDADTRFRVLSKGEEVYLEMALDREWGSESKARLVTTEMLGTTEISRQGFENPDGSPLAIDHDLLGRPRSGETPFPGPIEVSESVRRIKIWSGP